VLLFPFLGTVIKGRKGKGCREKIAKQNLILAVDHLVPEDSFMILREGRDLGVKRIVVTHADRTMSTPQMKEGARLVAY